MHRTGAPVEEVKVVIVKKLWSVESALRGLRDVARGLLLYALRSLALRVEYPKVVMIALLGRGCLGLVGEDLRALRTVNISGSVHLLARAESHCGSICKYLTIVENCKQDRTAARVVLLQEVVMRSVKVHRCAVRNKAVAFGARLVGAPRLVHKAKGGVGGWSVGVRRCDACCAF